MIFPELHVPLTMTRDEGYRETAAFFDIACKNGYARNSNNGCAALNTASAREENTALQGRRPTASPA